MDTLCEVHVTLALQKKVKQNKVHATLVFYKRKLNRTIKYNIIGKKTKQEKSFFEIYDIERLLGSIDIHIKIVPYTLLLYMLVLRGSKLLEKHACLDHQEFEKRGKGFQNNRNTTNSKI